MRAIDLISSLEEKLDVAFYSGVPDSLLSSFTGELMKKYNVSDCHMIAANEGNAVGLAAGFHLATGKIPCVYMQNSGQGNIVNPFASLMAPDVYKIPCVFVVGWRGQPGVKDEPQHVFQGRITEEIMELLEIKQYVIRKETSLEDLQSILLEFRSTLNEGKCVAFIIEKNALTSDYKPKYENQYLISREAAIEKIVENIGEAPIISTTGKASRELFEIRERKGLSHQYDFLTVGSMGHSSSIALSIATQKKETKVWCIDGDGALLMHMGSMALIGANAPENLVHIILNNESHETVGGMPTVIGKVDVVALARACGYHRTYCVSTLDELETVLAEAKIGTELTLIEVKVALGARSDLGRPTTTAIENKESFMEYLKGIC